MKKIILIAIIILAFVLRFYQLNSYPALNADEAAIGYNAYSLLQTGKDEHGNSWPIHFQSFNDYKPGLYVYMILPFVATLGLNEWAVRIPGAFLGVLTILLVYFLARQLSLREGTTKQSLKLKDSIEKDRHAAARDDSAFPLLVALFLAISPWHIHFSRGGWEVNVATFFITVGLLFFLKGLSRPKFFVLSSVFFVLSLYSYHAARIIVPLLGIGLIVIYRKELLQVRKKLVIPVVLGVLVLLPLALDLTGPAGISRASGVGLFADSGPLARINEQRGEHEEIDNISTKLLHNKAVNYGLAFMENWMDHYNGNFLFLTGDDIQRNKIPGMGQTYLFAIVTCAVGLYSIAKRIFNYQLPICNELPINKLSNSKLTGNWKLETGNFKLIFWWFIVAPLAAALTFQSPHALRAQNMVIPFEIINAFGLYAIIQWIYKKNWGSTLKFLVLSSLFLVISLSFARYLHMYYIHMAKEYPFSSQYGVKELVSYIQSKESDYQKVLVTDRYDQPYILFLFFMKYPPAQFQKEHLLTSRDQFGFSTVRSFGKYNFWPIDFEASKRDYPNSLIVGTDEQIPNEANIVKKMYGSNGYMYFKVVAN